MSARRSGSGVNNGVQRLRSDLEELKASARKIDALQASGADSASHEFDKLNAVEQSAANLGVNPSSYKPIAFLNNGHYNQLIQANMLDDNLARRIEAYRHVAASDGVKA
jgi:hypothetical protein|tara:strand:- start:8620 stop:8946 length:327 start_codon:yes stop_codon:yes gene_type:complete